MRNFLVTFFLLFISSVMLISCGSSKAVTDKDDTNKKNNTKVKAKKIIENFDITPYREKIDVKPNSNLNKSSHLNIWYGYEKDNNVLPDTAGVIDRVNGFRVEILSTDKLSQAKSMQDRVSRRINQKHIYILFDPPFMIIQEL